MDKDDSTERPVSEATDAQTLRDALSSARDWIGSSAHGDNCFLHDDGGEYDACFCGKDSLESHLDEVLGAACPASPETLGPDERLKRAQETMDSRFRACPASPEEPKNG